jgi:hypothetical protein
MSYIFKKERSVWQGLFLLQRKAEFLVGIQVSQELGLIFTATLFCDHE